VSPPGKAAKSDWGRPIPLRSPSNSYLLELVRYDPRYLLLIEVTRPGLSAHLPQLPDRFLTSKWTVLSPF
jgi:hypothetical protein